MRLTIVAAFLTTAAVLSLVSIAAAQSLPQIVHRIYIGYFTPIDQDLGVIGTLRSTDGTCTFTLVPPPPNGYGNDADGPQGGKLMQGSGSCKGMFELDIFPFTGLGSAVPYNGGGAGVQAGGSSDFGFIGRFNIESVTLSNNNPPGYPSHYSTITTGTVTILHSPSNNLGGTNEGAYAVMLDGITTRGPIN